MKRRFVALSAAAAVAAVATALLPAAASADGIETEVPWASSIRGSVERTGLTARAAARARAAQAPTGISGLRHVGNSDNDGVTNSDLAFWGNRAYAGNYDGFRILDITNDQPVELADYRCVGAQSDPTVWDTGSRRLLFQSVDSRRSSDACENTTVSDPKAPAFEGIRIFDVTNPADIKYLGGVQTDCGSHTNTLIPDPANRQLFLYISSYPLGAGVTAPAAETGFGTECVPPHKKISILKVPYSVQSEEDVTVKEQPP